MIRRIILILTIVFGAAIVLYGVATGRLELIVQSILNEETNAAIFIALYVVLPMVGFPISVFLLLMGIKFEMVTGILIMCGGMAVHIALSFPAANTLLRPLVMTYLSKTRYRLPQFSQKKFLVPSIVFMSIPGLSYTMKNYIFSLSGIRFRYYFIIGWLTQAILGIPVVIAGDLLNPAYFWYALLFFVMAGAGYYIWQWKRKKASNRNDFTPVINQK